MPRGMVFAFDVSRQFSVWFWRSRSAGTANHTRSFNNMPDQETIRKAQQDEAEGKSPSTQAGEFVREEVHHVRQGKHGARSAKQAVAIGLSKARRAGVKLSPPKGSVAPETRRTAQLESKQGRGDTSNKRSAKRSRAVKSALKREGREAASPRALARQGRVAAKSRSKKSRSVAAKEAARTRKSRKRKSD
jgi:hypothetical protein